MPTNKVYLNLYDDEQELTTPKRQQGVKSGPRHCRRCNQWRTHEGNGLCKRCYNREYHRDYRERPGVKEYYAEYRADPVNKAKQRDYMKGYKDRPGVREAKRESERKRTERLGGRGEHRRHRRVLEMVHGPTCQICGMEHKSGDTMQVDHIWPVSHASTFPGRHLPRGVNSLCNLRLTCPSCNASKHDTLPTGQLLDALLYRIWRA